MMIRILKKIYELCIHVYYHKDRYKPSNNKIEIDITYACNLKCYNCNRSCTQAPSSEYMSVGQIKKFIAETVEQGKKWKQIRVLGGEPCLHPDLLEIIGLLIEYKNINSPRMKIILTTNGFGSKIENILSKISKMVKIENTRKQSKNQDFYAFNMAPIDYAQSKDADFSKGCDIVEICGIGLTPHGYYPCGVAGSIDRVFGFDCGRKKLPTTNDAMIDQMQTLCRYCGRFNWDYRTTIVKDEMSPSWQKAYKAYKNKQPELTFY